MTEILTTAQVLRYVADNLDAGRPNGHGLQMACGTSWVSIECVFGDTDRFKYRLKPRTRILNGFEVPAPMDSAPKIGGRYWTIEPRVEGGVSQSVFSDGKTDLQVFVFGLMFSTREDAAANLLAICGIDPNK